MKLTHLRTNQRINPLGIDKGPCFSWHIESLQQNTTQTAYRIVVSAGGKDAWDSDMVVSGQQSFIPCEGALQSCTSYIWTVTAWDNHGNQATQSACFETGLFSEDWKAQWVESTAELVTTPLPPFWDGRPAVWFEKKFPADGEVRRARLYASAHGVYHAYLNGSRPDDREFAPEHTAYDSILYYQTYVADALLKQGENLLQLHVADGWYHCPQTRQRIRDYQDAHAVIFQMEIEYTDGRRQIICSDGTEACYTGKIQYSDLYLGEKENAAQENGARHPVRCAQYPHQGLIAQPMDPVRPVMLLPAVNVYRSSNGEWIVDFGQVICGRARVSLDVPRGTEVTLEYFEVPDLAGNYCNTMFAPQKDIYISDGTPCHYEARFTFHGFRYIRVSGLENVKAEDFTAVVLSSQKESVGSFSCSDDRLNRLYENIRWSQRNNTLSIPTDCPTREKAGFTGDIQIYAKTALRNENMTPFLTGWLLNLQKAQADNGAVPIVVPETAPYIRLMEKNAEDFGDRYPVGVAGWSDAAVIVPYEMYMATGNRLILEKQYGSMVRWCDYVIRTAKEGLWKTGFHFGEWLIPSKPHNLTHREACENSAFYTAPIFGWLSLHRMSEIAEILQRPDTAYYRNIAENMKQKIQESLIVDGTLQTENMGAYVLMIALELVPEGLREAFGKKLVDLLEKNGGCLDTGFLATPYLLDAFTKIGRKDLAVSLLMQNKCPSWLYQVEQGATSIWESWDAIVPGQDPNITSYDHYAFGCVDSWIFENVAGIQLLEPGFRSVRIAPEPELLPVQWCDRTFLSIYGEIRVRWDRDVLKVTIPCGVTAEVIWKNKNYRIGSGSPEFR